jgi:hypothetical protein
MIFPQFQHAFITQDNVYSSKFMKGIGIILSILTLGMFYFFFFEYFFRYHYWVNRFRLYRYLKSEEGVVSYAGTLPLWNEVHIFTFKYENHLYRILEFRNGEAIILTCFNCPINKSNNNLIGLWTFSPIMYHMNHKISNELHKRADF